MAGEGQGKKKFSFGFSAIPLMLLLPPLVWWMWWCMMNQPHGAMKIPDASFVRDFPWPNTRAIAIWTGWFLFQAALQIYAPGPWVDGQPLKDGSRLKYKMNGWFSWWATFAALGIIMAVAWALYGFDQGAIRVMTILYDEFGPLMMTVNIFTFALCAYLYFWGWAHPDDGTPERDQQVGIAGVGAGGEATAAPVASLSIGRVFYDYFMGTSLNPRNGMFDWKLFCEARPGLIGWVIVNFAIAFKQYELHHTVSLAMVCVCFFHFWYIADYYLHEEAILTTWDIKHENFGWMLCWGDLTWLPFTYTLQALYLAQRADSPLPAWAYVPIVLLHFAGFTIFRGTNIQKHYFRKDPERPLKWYNVKPEFIQTRSGNRLLVNGFWGIARHLNYCGDLMMALSWCLVCGFEHLLPYFYIIYFSILLIHRERRDHVTCAEKYGPDWDLYCAKVRYRIFPGIY